MKAWREEKLKKKCADDKTQVIAGKVLENNEPIEKIVEYTGLRKVSVEKMRREMGK